MQENRSCKLQGSVSRTSLQIDMQNFCQYKIWLTRGKKIIFTKKCEIQGFIISVTIRKQESNLLPVRQSRPVNFQEDQKAL